MQKFKGTKGEWYLAKRGVSIWHPNNVGRRLALVDTKELNPDLEELANAQLISCAPEMLEMLKSILASEHIKGTVEESKIKQIIKKATTI